MLLLPVKKRNGYREGIEVCLALWRSSVQPPGSVSTQYVEAHGKHAYPRSWFTQFAGFTIFSELDQGSITPSHPIYSWQYSWQLLFEHRVTSSRGIFLRTELTGVGVCQLVPFPRCSSEARGTPTLKTSRTVLGDQRLEAPICFTYRNMHHPVHHATYKRRPYARECDAQQLHHQLLGRSLSLSPSCHPNAAGQMSIQKQGPTDHPMDYREHDSSSSSLRIFPPHRRLTA